MTESTTSVVHELRRRLPAGYLLAIAGIASGDTDEDLAARVDVHVAAVPTLLCLAAEKLLELTHAAVREASQRQNRMCGHTDTTIGHG